MKSPTSVSREIQTLRELISRENIFLTPEKPPLTDDHFISKVKAVLLLLNGLGTTISLLRSIIGWSQEDLALNAGPDLKRAYLSKIETGERANPSPEKLRLIASALHLEIEDLLILCKDLRNCSNDKKSFYLDLKYTFLKNWAKRIENVVEYDLILKGRSIKNVDVFTSSESPAALSSATNTKSASLYEF